MRNVEGPFGSHWLSPATRVPLFTMLGRIEMALKFPVSDDALEEYMHGDAARLILRSPPEPAYEE